MTALACIETSTITRGMVILDVLLKRAPVSVVHAGRHSPGKFIVLFRGDVASVEESHEEVLATVKDGLLDELLLAQPHAQILDGLESRFSTYSGDALLLVETTHVSSAIHALDHTLKLIDAQLIDLQFAQTIGGKGYFVLESTLSDVDYAHSDLLSAFSGRLVAVDIIGRPHEDLVCALTPSDPFGPRNR